MTRSPTADPRVPATSAPQRAAAAPSKQAKLMVVDDEPTNVKLVQRFLELDGYDRFVTTTDARRAVRLARDERPDCILLDLMMPYVSGLDILDAAAGRPRAGADPRDLPDRRDRRRHPPRRPRARRHRFSQQADRSLRAGAARRQRRRRQGVSGPVARPQPRPGAGRPRAHHRPGASPPRSRLLPGPRRRVSATTTPGSTCSASAATPA